MNTFRSEAVATLDVAPETVYRVLADYREHHPRILPKPAFEKLEVEKGGVGAGTVIRVTMRVMGRAQTFRMQVTEPQPGRVLAETDLDSGAVTTFVVDPVDGGKRSRVAIATQWVRRPGLGGWIESRVNPKVTRPLYEKELRLLEDYARTLA